MDTNQIIQIINTSIVLLGVFVSAALALMVYRLNKRIAEAQIAIEKQKSISDIYKTLLEIKRFTDDLIFVLTRDITNMLQSDEYYAKKKIYVETVKSLKYELDKNEAAFQLNYPEYKKQYYESIGMILWDINTILNRLGYIKRRIDNDLIFSEGQSEKDYNKTVEKLMPMLRAVYTEKELEKYQLADKEEEKESETANKENQTTEKEKITNETVAKLKNEIALKQKELMKSWNHYGSISEQIEIMNRILETIYMRDDLCITTLQNMEKIKKEIYEEGDLLGKIIKSCSI